MGGGGGGGGGGVAIKDGSKKEIRIHFSHSGLADSEI